MPAGIVDTIDPTLTPWNLMRKSFRFWLVYGVAWLPYAASYMTLFLTHLGRTFFEATKGSIINVLPAALLGIGVVGISKRLRWSTDRRYKLLTAHLVLASIYVFLWTNAVPFLNAVGRLVQSGAWSFKREGSFQGGFFPGLLIYVTIAGIVYAVQTTERLRAEEARATRAENLRTRAELEALRAQLNPHFLFNTLHSLMTLVRHDPVLAENALERLAALLRHTLMTMKDPEDVELSEELDFVENYLALERLRLGDRLRVEKRIQAETLACRLPPFTLQPLIENSIRHAISTQTRGGLLQINTERRNGLLCIEVLDDGPGAKPEDVEASNGIGVRVVRQRLLTRYGDQASFRLQTEPGMGFSVRMEIPTNGSERS